MHAVSPAEMKGTLGSDYIVKQRVNDATNQQQVILCWPQGAVTSATKAP